MACLGNSRQAIFNMEYTLLVDRDEAKKVEEEECAKFIKEVLLNLGLEEVEEFWPNLILSAKEKKLLAKYLDKCGVVIVYDGDRGYKVLSEDDTLIAEWKKPFFVMKMDPKAKTFSKKVYYEIHFEGWTVFEGEEDE